VSFSVFIPGAFGGFAIPPMLAFAVRDLGPRGYSIGFIVFVFLSLLSLTMAWLLKYMGSGLAQSHFARSDPHEVVTQNT